MIHLLIVDLLNNADVVTVNRGDYIHRFYQNTPTAKIIGEYVDDGEARDLAHNHNYEHFPNLFI